MTQQQLVWQAGAALPLLLRLPQLLTYPPYCARSSFGELALLYSSPRQATVRAATRCRLWVMQRPVFNAVQRNFTQEQFAARHRLLESVPSLKHLSPHHRALLVDALVEVRWRCMHGCVWHGCGAWL